MIDQTTFNKELKSFSKDLELHMDYEARRWGVYQMRSSHFVLTGPAKPWKLFTIEDEKGDFRAPRREDLLRALKSVQDGHKLWSKGGDWYTAQIEKQEGERKAKHDAEIDDTFRQAAKEASRSIRRTSIRR